jgi:DNA-binding NarL/FixJ family response regulator
MGGRAAIEQLRRYDPTARIVVSSGYSNDQVIKNFGTCGFSRQLISFTGSTRLKTFSKKSSKIKTLRPV